MTVSPPTRSPRYPSVASPYRDAAPLEYYGGVGDWWYQQDVSHEQDTRADQMTQNDTPLRCGQRQGYVISLYNPTDLTQTIAADAASPYTSWNNPGSATRQPAPTPNRQAPHSLTLRSWVVVTGIWLFSTHDHGNRDQVRGRAVGGMGAGRVVGVVVR
jgi:hypothetical protein